ncbi:hypothetical protein J6590_053865 [Homalodisca vitripennis]|nr:hypothetical protein J6590_053865 [Homalodisca vitripennis]
MHPTPKAIIHVHNSQFYLHLVCVGSNYGIAYFKKSKECFILPGEVRAKKPSLTLNLGTNGLKVTSEPPLMAGQAGRLQGQDRSAVTYPSSGHVRRCLIWLPCDNRRTRYTAPLANFK